MSSDSLYLDQYDHICACSMSIHDHREQCHVGEPDTFHHPDGTIEHNPFHSHYPPLCCPECACLSFEEAHPEVVGTPLAALSELLGRRPLPTRLVRILNDHGIYTIERAMAHRWGEVYHWKGVGRATMLEFRLMCIAWASAQQRGDVVSKPLPETLETGTVRY